MAVAIGHGPQVAQGEDPITIRLEKNKSELKRKNTPVIDLTTSKQSKQEGNENNVESSGDSINEADMVGVEGYQQQADANSLVTSNTNTQGPLQISGNVPTINAALVPQERNQSMEVAAEQPSGLISPQGLTGLFNAQGSSNMNNLTSYAFYQQQQQSLNTSNNFHNTLAATGSMIGNIAKGLMEGASPIINSILLMHKVVVVYII